MRIKRKLLIVCAVVLAAVMLSGCSATGLNPQNLMRPPRATGEKEDIHQVLESNTDGNLVLKYPRRGDYRSAIILRDLSGDKNEEAVALYQSGASNGSDAAGITIGFVAKSDGEWKEIASFTNAAAQVDKICFGDVNKDGKDEAVVGWGSGLTGTATICVYSVDDGKVSELSYTQPYSEMVVGDFVGNGSEQIFTSVITNGDQTAIARLLQITDNMVETLGSAHMDTGVTRYVSITAGLINEKQFGVVLDGAKGAGTFVTELLYWDRENKLLKAPFFDAGTLSSNYTLRNTSAISMDINNDKIIEIPIVNLLPGYPAPAPDETGYLTNWHRYESKDNSMVRAMSMVINREDSYWFLIPDMWRGKITTQTDRESDSMTFYEWVTDQEGKNGAYGAALLKLQVFTEKAWNDGGNTANFSKLTEQNGMVYAASILQPDNALSLSISDVKSSFKLISSQS